MRNRIHDFSCFPKQYRIFVRYTNDKELISRIYKEMFNPLMGRHTSIKKMEKNLCFPKEDIQISFVFICIYLKIYKYLLSPKKIYK